MSVIDFIVPFLQTCPCQCTVLLQLTCVQGLRTHAHILKFPPTKNWRAMFAAEICANLYSKSYVRDV